MLFLFLGRCLSRARSQVLVVCFLRGRQSGLDNQEIILGRGCFYGIKNFFFSLCGPLVFPVLLTSYCSVSAWFQLYSPPSPCLGHFWALWNSPALICKLLLLTSCLFSLLHRPQGWGQRWSPSNSSLLLQTFAPPVSHKTSPPLTPASSS